MELNRIINDDCLAFLKKEVKNIKNPVIVSDPPFNIGYHYKTYNDKKEENEYFEWLSEIFSLCPSVVIHYPESLYRLSLKMGCVPERVVSWVYNSNTARQHRDIAFFGIKPDFNRVKQPYKNLNDKRIIKRIEQGKTGCKLYDWWNINQVKNVSKQKTSHPCQMPVDVMKKIIGILPDNVTIIDPFMGSGTTGVACVCLKKNFIGVEIDKEYYQISKERIEKAMEEERKQMILL